MISSQIIWKVVRDKLQAEEKAAVIKQGIYVKRLPASLTILDHSIDNIEQILKEPALDQDKRAALSCRRLKTIAQFKFDMMNLTIAPSKKQFKVIRMLLLKRKRNSSILLVAKYLYQNRWYNY